MEYASVLQLIGTVSGVLLSISGLVLVNSFNFLNEAKNRAEAAVHQFELFALEHNLDRDAVIREAAKASPIVTEKSWTEFSEGAKKTRDELEGIRKMVWRSWKLVLVPDALSLVLCGIGLLVSDQNPPALPPITYLAAVFLMLGVYEFYRLATSVFVLSGLAAGAAPTRP